MGALAVVYYNYLMGSTGKINPTIDFSRISMLYSNVYYSMPIGADRNLIITFKGAFMSKGWAVLESYLKPSFITANNTSNTFEQLTYNASAPENPIADTPYKFAWSYDEANALLYTKFLLNSSAVRITVHY